MVYPNLLTYNNPYIVRPWNRLHSVIVHQTAGMSETNISESLFAYQILTSSVPVTSTAPPTTFMDKVRPTNMCSTSTMRIILTDKTVHRIILTHLTSSWLAGTIRRFFCRGRPRTTTREFLCVGLVLG